MNGSEQKEALRQLDAVRLAFEKAAEGSPQNDMRSLQRHSYIELITMARAAIERIAGLRSVYNRQSELMMAERSDDFVRATSLSGVVKSLYADVEAGYLMAGLEK